MRRQRRIALFALMALATPLAAQVQVKEMSPGLVLLPHEIKSDNVSLLWEARSPIDLDFDVIETGGARTLIVGQDGQLTELAAGRFYELMKFEGKAGQTVVASVIEAEVIDGKVQFDRQVWKLKFKSKPDTPDPEPEPDDPDTPEPDTPTPDVPEDDFDNVGRRVAKWASGLPRTEEAAKCYRDAAKLLQEDQTITMKNAGIRLSQCLRQKVDMGVFKSVFDNIDADFTQRWSVSPMSRGVMADYYSAIANGFEGSK